MATSKADGATAPKKKASKAAGGTQTKPKKVRKRKPTARPNAASTKELLNDAKTAAQDLAQQRAQTAARRADPLWYKMDEVAAIVKDESAMAPQSTVLPEQLQIVEAALAHHGLSQSDVTPQALACLLEQSRRVAQEFILDAQDYAYTANRTELTRADLLLASELRADNPTAVSTQRQLPKLNLVAQQMNRVPLPPIPSHCYSGIVLPNKSQQLTARTYDLVSAATTQRKLVQAAPQQQQKQISDDNNNTPSYGATKGRQIPVKLNTPAATTTTSNTAAAATTATSGVASNTATAATATASSNSGGGAIPMDTSSSPPAARPPAHSMPPGGGPPVTGGGR